MSKDVSEHKRTSARHGWRKFDKVNVTSGADRAQCDVCKQKGIKTLPDGSLPKHKNPLNPSTKDKWAWCKGQPKRN